MWKICILVVGLLENVRGQAPVAPVRGLLSLSTLSTTTTSLTKTVSSPLTTSTTTYIRVPLYSLPDIVTAGVPTYDGKTCVRIWSKEGTACNTAPLISYESTNTSNILKTTTATKAKLSAIPNNIQDSAQCLSLPSLSKRLLQQTVLSPALAQAALFNLAPFTNSTLISAYLNNITSCWGYLEKARNASLCSVCSKNNSQYFFNGKAIVSQADCTSMLNACSSYYDITATLLASANAFTKDASTWIGSVSFGANIIQLSGFVTDLIDKMFKANLTGLLTSYKSSTGNSKVLTGNKICSRVFRLHQSTLFEVMDKVLAVVNFLVNAISGLVVQTDLAQLKELAPAPANNYVSFNRRVLEDSPEFNPFEGDVVILQPTDNMFVSFDGAQGTQTGTGNTAHTPMNLTTCFP